MAEEKNIFEQFIEERDKANEGGTPPATPPVTSPEIPPVTTPPVETPPNNIPPDDPPKPEDTPPATPTELTKSLDIEYINSKLGSQYKDATDFELSIKELLQKAEKYSGIDEKLKLIEQKEKYMAESGDILNYFDSETDYKLSILKKQHPEWVKKEISNLSNLDTLSDADVLRLNARLTNQRVKDDEIANGILKYQYQVDLSNEEDLTPQEKAYIGTEADKIRNELKAKIDEVKLPEKINYDERIQQAETEKQQKLETVTKSWEPILNSIQTGNDAIKTLSIPGSEFTFALDDEGRKEIAGYADQIVKNSLTEVSADNYRAVMDTAFTQYFVKNMPKIHSAMIEDAVAKNNKEWEERQKGTPPRRDETPAPQNQDDEALQNAANKMLNGFK